MSADTQHRFSRTELLIGKEGLERLYSAKVAVVGLGGVGSYTVEALARAGVGRFILVDFDEVCLTNTNRQIHAVAGNYGRPKIEVMTERVKAINPKAEVIPRKEFLTSENLSGIIDAGISYVADAIDTVWSKVALIEYCVQNEIPIISSMGTGNKFNPLAFRVDDIGKTHTCPLAKAVRKSLREKGITKGVKVVYSPEPPVESRSDVLTCHHGCICPQHGQGQVWNCTKRRKIPGSMPYLPPIAGLIMAGVIIQDLAKVEPTVE
jgi:tRNA A37 threonylcarbamoyladenosine dehydratase